MEVLLLHELGVRGIDFRVFDPRVLYPSEDRFSFVFLESKEAPFLDGLIAAIDDREFTAKVYVSGLQSASGRALERCGGARARRRRAITSSKS